jgi:hypothetical protein
MAKRVEKMCLRMNQPIWFYAPIVKDEVILPIIKTELELAFLRVKYLG